MLIVGIATISAIMRGSDELFFGDKTKLKERAENLG
jgi:hypothetical protein